MSKSEICSIYDQSLKILDQNYIPSGVIAECYIWQIRFDTPTTLEGIENPAYFENVSRLSDEKNINAFQRPWSEEPVVNGVAIKVVSNIFSENVIAWITEHWNELPMSSRDFLIEHSKEGQDQEPLRNALKTILEEK